MRKNRTRNLTVAAGIIIVAILLFVFVRPRLSGKKTEPLSAPSAVTMDKMGNKVIDWDSVQVPDWIERDLIPVNEYSRPGTALTALNGVVVHYTANPGTSAKQNRDYFAGLAEGGGTYVSSHFIIDTDGTIIQCIPMSEMSYASNDRNSDTISIECCHKDESGKFTKETYASLVRLTAWLCDTYGIGTENVVRHYDVTGKICPKYFVDHEDKWEEFLKDVENTR